MTAPLVPTFALGTATSDSRWRDCSAFVAGRSPIVELPTGTWESAEAIAMSGLLGRVNS